MPGPILWGPNNLAICLQQIPASAISGGGGGGIADGKYTRTTRFASIGSGTSGTVTLPPVSTVVLDDFGGTVDAVITQISGGKPTKQASLTATGAVVSTTFDSSGNWVLSGTPASYPVAIVYRVQQTWANFDDTATNIWGEPDRETARAVSIGATFDGLGSVLAVGSKCYVYVPYGCTIQSWTILADQVGSVVIDVWKVAYASYPPTVANTITSTDIPTVSSAIDGQNAGITAWSTTAITSGDVVGFNINSCSTITRALILIKVIKL